MNNEELEERLGFTTKVIDGVTVKYDNKGNVLPQEYLLNALMGTQTKEDRGAANLGMSRECRLLRIYRRLRDEGIKVDYVLSKFGSKIDQVVITDP